MRPERLISAGRQLAIHMLREIAKAGADACALDPSVRKGSQQNIVARHLQTLCECDSVFMDAGFGEILSDYLAGAQVALIGALLQSRPVPPRPLARRG